MSQRQLRPQGKRCALPWVSTVAVIFLLSVLGGRTRQAVQAQGSPPPGLRNIQHVIFIIKENRTFDNYFGLYPGGNGATSGTISTGQVIPLSHMLDTLPGDFCHAWNCAIDAIDGGKMDGFNITSTCLVNGQYLCYSQFQRSDIPNYFAYAQNFALSDATFSSLHGPSYPNHMCSSSAPLRAVEAV